MGTAIPAVPAPPPPPQKKKMPRNLRQSAQTTFLPILNLKYND